jgi:hypothetical protein
LVYKMNPNLSTLTFQEQDVIELLIFGNNTDVGVSKELLLDGATVARSILWGLRKKGLVRNASGLSGYACYRTWQYCGGPVGDFFKVQQQTLLESEKLRFGRI